VKKTFIYFSIIFALLFQFLSAQDRINLNIELYKDNYLVWEPIFLKIVLVNNSEDTVKYVLQKEFEYEIKDSKGKEYEYEAIHGIRGPIVIGGPPLYHNLLPKQTLILLEYQDILYFCGDYLELDKGYKWCGPSVGIRKFLPPERYTISVSREITVKSGTEARTRNLESTREFLVNEPTGEDKSAMELYEEAIIITWARKKEDVKFDWKERALLKYNEIAEKYPNSIYAPLALSYVGEFLHLAERGGFEGNKKALEIEKKIINLYPDTPFAFESLKKIPMRYANMREMDEEKIKGDIQVIIDKYPDKRIGKEAAKLLKEFEEGKSSYHRIMKMRENFKSPEKEIKNKKE